MWIGTRPDRKGVFRGWQPIYMRGTLREDGKIEVVPALTSG